MYKFLTSKPQNPKEFLYEISWVEYERLFVPVQRKLWLQSNFPLISFNVQCAWVRSAPKALNADKESFTMTRIA